MTKKIVPTILALLLLLSCQTNEVRTNEAVKQNDSIKFDFVDFTLMHQFATTSVHIDSSKNVVGRVKEASREERFFAGVLAGTLPNKFDSLLKIILKSQRDTNVGRPVPDGAIYKIIFKTKDKIITVTNLGDSSCRAIDKLIFSVDKQCFIMRRPSTDTNFDFLSRDIIPKPVKSHETK